MSQVKLVTLPLLLLAGSFFLSSCASVYILNNNSAEYQAVQFIYIPGDLDSTYYHKKLARFQKQEIIQNLETSLQDSSLRFRFLMAPNSRIGLNQLFWFTRNTGKEEKVLCLPDMDAECNCYKVTNNDFAAFRQRGTSRGTLFKWIGRPQYDINLRSK